MVITESGYLEVFAYNNAQTPVFFDNIELRHTSGPVLEENHYYPFGMLMDMSYMPLAVNERNFYKYNSKELQPELNWNVLDFGARMLDGPRWMAPDPLSEMFYDWSPFNYALCNPLKYIDPDGRRASPYFDIKGIFLGIDEKGYKGNIFITTKEAFAKHSEEGIARSGDIQSDTDTKIVKEVQLTAEAESNIYTHAMLRTEGVDFSKLYNNKVSILEERSWNGKEVVTKGFNDPDDYLRFGFSKTKDGKYKITAVSGSNLNDLTTVELIQNSLGVHEYDGHGNKGYSGGNSLGGTHWQAYLLQVQHPTFQFLPKWRQDEILLRVREFMHYENPTLFKKHFGKE
ncbi:MAG: hypothetical protein LBQ60_16095 [Bacteroidales bacterium]|nr:hypothetical protein [Bacteroidales bacterium]